MLVNTYVTCFFRDTWWINLFSGFLIHLDAYLPCGKCWILDVSPCCPPLSPRYQGEGGCHEYPQSPCHPTCHHRVANVTSRSKCCNAKHKLCLRFPHAHGGLTVSVPASFCLPQHQRIIFISYTKSYICVLLCISVTLFDIRSSHTQGTCKENSISQLLFNSCITYLHMCEFCKWIRVKRRLFLLLLPSADWTHES